MFRAARRLRLEPFEDRSLPSAPTPVPHPPAETAAHTAATGGESAEEDPSEYTTSATRSDAGANTMTPAVRPGRPMVPDYVVAAYPAAPPMPAGLTPVPAPAVAEFMPATAAASPATGAIIPAPVAPSPTPLPAPTPAAPEQTASAPPDDRPANPPAETLPDPSAGSGDRPAVPDGEFPPVGSVLPSFDDLGLQLNLAGWADAAARLFDGLDAVIGLPDGESPWARLGYWALVVGTVGVTVELTRQGLRAKQPEPAERPPLPVRR